MFCKIYAYFIYISNILEWVPSEGRRCEWRLGTKGKTLQK